MPLPSNADQVVVQGFLFDEETGGGLQAAVTSEPVALTGQSAAPMVLDAVSHAHIQTRPRTTTPDPVTGYWALLALATNDPDLEAYGGRRITLPGQVARTIEVPWDAPQVTVSAGMAAQINPGNVDGRPKAGDTVRVLWFHSAAGYVAPTPAPAYYDAAATRSLIADSIAAAGGGSGTADLPEVDRTTAASDPTTLLGKTTRFSTTSAAVNQTLPAAQPGRQLAVGWDAGTNALTLTAAGSDVVGAGSATTVPFAVLGHLVTLHCTVAGRWRVTSGFTPQAAQDARYMPRPDETGPAVGKVPAVTGTGPTAYGLKTLGELGAVQASLVDAKGDQIVGSANDTVVRVPVGANGKVWTADDTAPSGVSWQTPTGGGGGGAVSSVNGRTGAVDTGHYTSALQEILGRLRTAVQDVTILVVSDSTAIQGGSWCDQLPALLAAKYPAWNISYAKWNDSTSTYNIPTVTTGTGSRTLYLYNGSMGGKTWSYALDDARRVPLAITPDPDLIVFSLGHNESNTTTSYYQLRDRAVISIERMRAHLPKAQVVLLSQNPMGAFPGMSERRANIYRRICAQRGYGFIDVCQAFYDDGRSQAVLVGGDQIHPTADGYTLWANTVAAAFVSTPASQVIPIGRPSLHTARKNLLGNGDFTDFAAPPTLPGWTATNVTPSKDTTNTETKTYSAAMTKTAAGSTAYISAAVPPKLAVGREITLAVRMWVPAGAGANVGQLQILDGVSAVAASLPWSDLRGQWIWSMLTARIAPTASTVTARIMVDTTTGSTLETLSIDRAVVVVGNLPEDTYGQDTAAASGGSGGAVPMDVQTFTSSGTWNKPSAGQTRARIGYTAGGGAGGSGRKGASASVCCGGGGGAHGAQGVVEVALADLPSTLTVTIAAVAAGGAAVSTNDTSGAAGAQGGNVTVVGTGFNLQARGGAGGGGGTASTGTAGSAIATGMFPGAIGAAASTTGGNGNAATNAGNASGASGGGIPTGATFSTGGNGVSANQVGGTLVAAAGGTSDGAAGANADGTGISASIMPPSGRSGGGGASSVTGAGGSGGAGAGYGFGGSGGGAALNAGGNSGAGGAGGPACVVIQCY